MLDRVIPGEDWKYSFKVSIKQILETSKYFYQIVADGVSFWFYKEITCINTW